MLIFPRLKAREENRRLRSGVAANVSVNLRGPANEAPLSPEIESLDFLSKQFDVRQVSMMVHVGDLYTTYLCMIKKYICGL